jgi:hypothetical protein
MLSRLFIPHAELERKCMSSSRIGNGYCILRMGFMPSAPLHRWERAPMCPLHRRLGESQSRYAHGEDSHHNRGYSVEDVLGRNDSFIFRYKTDRIENEKGYGEEQTHRRSVT